jgi:hypothetical protein
VIGFAKKSTWRHHRSPVTTSAIDIEPKPMRRIKALCLFIVASLALLVTLFAESAYGAQVTLAWDPTGDSAVIGYKLHWGSQSCRYTLLADVGAATTETVSNLQVGTTYYFAATVYDAKGNESGYSNEVSYTIPGGCTYSISPASKTFGQTGGTGTVAVTTQSACSWNVSSGASWMTITSGSSGTGNGTVYYSVSPYTGPASRTSASTIAGQAFTITQTGVPTYTLTTAKSGTGSGAVTNSPGGTTFTAGTTVTLTATPNANSTFAGWSGACSGSSTTCRVTMSGNVSVGASFAVKTYIISASAGTGGKISPSGSVSVNAGASQSFTMAPVSRYRVSYLKVDGTVLSSATSYTFSNVQANHSISVYFRIR